MTSSQPQSHNKIAHLKEQKHYKLIVTAVDIFKLLELQYGRQPNLPQFAVRFFYYFPCKNYNTIYTKNPIFGYYISVIPSFLAYVTPFVLGVDFDNNEVCEAEEAGTGPDECEGIGNIYDKYDIINMI